MELVKTLQAKTKRPLCSTKEAVRLFNCQTLFVLFMEIIFPLANNALYRIQGKGLTVACAILGFFMAINLIVTVAALLRWRQRQNDIPAESMIEVALDSYFTDDVMMELYPNMRFQP